MADGPLTVRDGDWEYARRLYEFTEHPTRFIAEAINRGQTTVVRRAADEKWMRGRKDYEGERTAQLVAAAVVQAKKERLETFEVMERVNVEMQAKVLVEHRADIKRARSICNKLFIELEDQLKHLPDLHDLGEILRSEDDRGRDKLNDKYKKILSLPDRSAAFKSLTEALKVVIALERQAFGIQGALEDPEKPQTSAETLAGMDKILSRFQTVLKPPGTVNVPATQIVETPIK
jgi:hypothetical protein